MERTLIRLKRNTIIFVLIFTFIIFIAFFYSFWRTDKFVETLAKENAEYFTTLAIKIVKWLSLKGGAYFIEDNRTKPSIYMNLPEKEVTLKSGKKYAYINVASIIREITSIKIGTKNVKIRLTSLYPVDPKNKPDSWEKKALKIIKNIKKPYFEFTKSNSFRYMYPLVFSKDCLKCHINLGLNIGELRGGISVTIPAINYIYFKKRTLMNSGIFYGIIWIFGIILCILFYYKNKKLIIFAGEANKKFKDIFDKSTLPMLILKDEIIVDCNNACVKILEAESKSQVIGLHPSEFSPDFQPDNKSSKVKASEMIQKAYEVGITSFEWVHKTFKNNIIWEIVTLTKIIEGKESQLFATMQDITHLKKVEMQLSTTLNSISEAIIVTDIDEKIMMVNPMGEKLAEKSWDNIIGNRFSDIFKIYNRKDSLLVESLLEFIRNNKKDYHKGTLFLDSDKRYSVEFYISELKEKDNNIQGFIVSIKDVTEKERIEEELSKFTTLKKLGTLAGGIAHDFNNLLTGIYGNVSLLKFKLKDESLKNYIDKIEKSLEQAVGLTNRLLTFAKGGTPVLKPQSLKEILKEIPEFYLRGSNIKFSYEIPDDLWLANIDKNLISNAISNLVINAIDAMKGGGELKVTAENFINSEDSEILSKGEYIKITIKDTGKGIDKKILDKIFDPFFTTKEKGNGLGLSIVYSIIEKHNGKIFVESEKGKGTTFTIYLPAIKFDKEVEIKIKEQSKDLIKKELKILIMDDEDIVRETLKDMLEIMGCKVDEAENGDKVIEKVKIDHYDIIFLDLTVPGGKGGVETVKEILKIDPEAKVIACSGYSFEDTIPNYKDLGFKTFLKKPFTFMEVKNLLFEICED